MMLLAMAWGLALVVIWDRAYHAFHHRLDWVIPSVLCSAAIVLGPFQQSAKSLLETFAPRRWWIIWPARAALVVAIAYALNYAVRYWDPDWPTQLSPQWTWLWPRALYRVILLAPLWGVWSMPAIGQFRRPTDGTDAATRHLIVTAGPLTTAMALALPLAGTFIFLMFLPPAMRFIPPAAAIAAGIGGGGVICRIRGAICRDALLATNLLTQLAFIAAYLAVR